MPTCAFPHVVDASMFWGRAGGVRRMLEAKQLRLPAFGFRHSIAAPGLHGPGCIDCGGVPLPASGGYRFVLSRHQAATALDAVMPDLIESADPYRLAWACLDAARRRGIACLAFCHSHLPLVAGRRFGATAERWAARYLAALYQRFDVVLAPSAAMVEALRGAGVSHVQHQPLGVDTTLFHPGRADARWRHGLLQRLQRDPETRLVVYAGRFAAEKNLQVLADAVGLLGPRWLLLLAGGGPEPPRGDQVVTLGVQHDQRSLARVLASCDAFVHAGDQETFGLAALEAMACGTRVVASDREGLGELVRGVGCTVDRLDARQWAEAIRATADPSHPVRTDTALARARGHDWSRIVAQMARRYARLTARPAAPRRAGAAALAISSR